MNLQTTLFDFQKAAVDKLIRSRVAGLFMDMGTGKTRTAIEFVYLRRKRIDRVIWFCPVSLKETVRQEIHKHTDANAGDIVVFDGKTSQRTINRNALWYIVGIESMSSSNRVVFAVHDLITTRSMVIVDESSYIKGHNSIRTQRITKIAQKARYRMLLTGTPISQGVADLYAQMRFLSPKILGYNSFYSFARNHLEYSDKYPGLIIESHNVAYLAAKMQPYIYQITKDECLDLPAKLTDVIYHSMTREQAEAYNQTKQDIWELAAEYEERYANDSYMSYIIFQLFTRLQLVSSGIYTKPEAGIRREINHMRTDALTSVIKRIPPDKQIVIWCKYIHSIHAVTQALSDTCRDDEVTLFYGDLNERQRNAQIEKFHNGARFFVATQSCGGHGLPLTEAHYVIFYENGFKYAERIQAEDRCHRIGQTMPVTYTDLVLSGSIDERIQRALSRKGDAVAEFRREIERVRGERSGALKKLIKGM